MNDLDKWSAEQCGIEYSTFDGFFKHQGKEFTLSDPRCMQIFREKFEIWTNKDCAHNWMCEIVHDGETIVRTLGQTISEAEMACAEAIYERR
ncbi:hypothetical protein OAO19_03085 [Gammaproteobacteria bacterium]|nr:hypothetical protein [Gammaproteobacteria bacterium]